MLPSGTGRRLPAWAQLLGIVLPAAGPNCYVCLYGHCLICRVGQLSPVGILFLSLSPEPGTGVAVLLSYSGKPDDSAQGQLLHSWPLLFPEPHQPRFASVSWLLPCSPGQLTPAPPMPCRSPAPGHKPPAPFGGPRPHRMHRIPVKTLGPQPSPPGQPPSSSWSRFAGWTCCAVFSSRKGPPMGPESRPFDSPSAVDRGWTE